MNYKEIKSKTDKKFELMDFKPGDVFSEMISYWEVIINRESDLLTVIQRSYGGGGHPRFEIKKFTVEEYVKHCSYSSGIGYWIDFMKNDESYVKSYIQAFIEQEGMSLDKIREFKLDLVL